jgi:gliding motility-associated lipoprotein GldH
MHKCKIFVFCGLFVCLLNACNKINVYEKQVSIPDFKWKKDFIPSFTFENTDKTSKKNIYVVIRHTNNYPYNNLWVRLTAKNATNTKADSTFNIQLTNQNKTWLGKGMDDIYEVRQQLTTFVGDTGVYTFALENIMRDNVLPEILNVGLRMEKQN